MMIVSLNAFFNDFSYLHFYLEYKAFSVSHEFDPVWKIGIKIYNLTRSSLIAEK